jgi:hypothetical protein
MDSKNTCVLLVAVPHARQGLCVQSEVGSEGMVVGSGDGLRSGDGRVRVAAREVAGDAADRDVAKCVSALSSDPTLRRE